MSSTESEVSVGLAGALFDTVVVPRAMAKRASRPDPYFALKGEPGALTYYVEPDVRVMSEADFELPGSGEPDGLIDALVAFWAAQGETELAESMAGRLKPIAEALGEETAQDDGSVDILCYTLF